MCWRFLFATPSQAAPSKTASLAVAGVALAALTASGRKANRICANGWRFVLASLPRLISSILKSIFVLKFS